MSTEDSTDVTNQEPVSPEQSTEESQPETQVQQSKETEVGSKEYNFGQLRAKNEELEYRINELVRKEQEKNAPPPPVEEQLLDDDILTVAQARKLASRQAEEMVTKVLNEREMARLPAQTRSQFSDFDQIMTQENIRKLEIEEPGLAQACTKSSNPYESTYKILKKFILPQKESKNESNNKKMEENLAKPISSNAVGRGPLSNANMWAESSKEDLYQEMISAARG